MLTRLSMNFSSLRSILTLVDRVWFLSFYPNTRLAFYSPIKTKINKNLVDPSLLKACIFFLLLIHLGNGIA